MRKLLCESDIEFRQIDIDELGLFLSLTTTKEELEMKDIYRYFPTRPDKGIAPTLTSSGTNKSVRKRWSSWTLSKGKSNSDTEIKWMVALALARSLEATLNNHIFLL